MKVYSVGDNIISPLGFTTQANFEALEQGKSGIKKLNDRSLADEELYGAAIDKDKLNSIPGINELSDYSYLEKLMILSIKAVLDPVREKINNERLLLIISTTKGNIDLLYNGNEKDSFLPELAKKINKHFNLPNDPLVISNACISGSSAIIVGKKVIQSGKYDHVLVSGGDILSEFIISGFNCLKAISDKPCNPYDKDRTGITLGEGAGTILISKDPSLCINPDSLAEIMGSGQANDANHISGPSRTGKGLKLAIQKAIDQSGIDKEEIGYINAHGTATLFNDEMESIAFEGLGLANIPLNSLKGYFGHTLGAAGIIESIMTIWQLNRGTLVKSPGYKTQGTTHKLNILESKKEFSKTYAMKTISGFGGCNAALIFKKSGARNNSI